VHQLGIFLPVTLLDIHFGNKIASHRIIGVRVALNCLFFSVNVTLTLIILIIRDAATHHYHYDGLGSTRYLSDASGTLTDSYDYESFGQLLNETGSTENRYRFAGEQLDSGLDQYYLRARYYNQYAGRFTQMDTWMGNNSDPVTLHKYLYANADPANMVDPSGNFGLTSIGVASNIQVELSMLQVDIGINFGNSLINGDSQSASSFGFAIILNLLPAKAALQLLRGGKFSLNQKVGAGHIRILGKVAKHERESAARIAELMGTRVLHRGSRKGPDLIIRGDLWEMKTLTSFSKNTLDDNIRRGLKNWKQIKRNTNRIIIDGTDIGLTKEMIRQG
jgi:RHS repeat-associated protein